MRNNAQSKIQELIREREIQEKASLKSESAPVEKIGELEDDPFGDMADLEELPDEEHICYAVRRQPGESPGLELWFQDNRVQLESYTYFRRALLVAKQNTLLLLFGGAKVTLHGRGLVHLIGLLNARKLTRLIEQHPDLDNGAEKIFITQMVTEVAEWEE